MKKIIFGLSLLASKFAISTANKPSKRDNNTWAPVTSFRIIAHVLLPLLEALYACGNLKNGSI